MEHAPLFIAPEIIDASVKHYNAKCDIYIVGITAVYLVIFKNNTNEKTLIAINNLKKGNDFDINLSNILTNSSGVVIKFIKKCIVIKPLNRYSARQLLSGDAFIKSKS